MTMKFFSKKSTNRATDGCYIEFAIKCDLVEHKPDKSIVTFRSDYSDFRVVYDHQNHLVDSDRFQVGKDYKLSIDTYE